MLKRALNHRDPFGEILDFEAAIHSMLKRALNRIHLEIRSGASAAIHSMLKRALNHGCHFWLRWSSNSSNPLDAQAGIESRSRYQPCFAVPSAAIHSMLKRALNRP